MGDTGTPPTLVVIVGPIASGKSTVAAALAVELRRTGRRVAVLDMIGRFDELLPAVRPSEWTFDTTVLGADQIVRQLADSLTGRHR